MDKVRHGAGTKQEGARRTWGRNADRDVRYAAAGHWPFFVRNRAESFLRPGRPVLQAVPGGRG